MGDRVVRGVLKRHVFNRRPTQSRDTMSPSTNCENGVTKSVEETKEGDPDAPYKASTPEDQWFVPDELYLVDTHFSRESNENELYIKHDVVTDSEKSDDTHLVWKTYHELTEDHIKSFNALKLNGLYLMIDSKKWELLLNPTNKLSIDRENHRIARRHFNEINNDRIDRIARLIMDNQKYFGKTQETLKDITFAVEIFNADDNYSAVSRRLATVVARNMEIQSRQKNLNWEFEMNNGNRPRKPSKFSIDVHMGTNSWYMGFVLADWPQIYPYFFTSKRYGAPMKDLMELVDVKKGMTVLDLNAGGAENLLELCRLIGLVNSQDKLDIAEENIKCAQWQFDIPSHSTDIVLVEEWDTLSEWFNMKSVQRVLYRSSKELEHTEQAELFDKLFKLMKTCSVGCVFFFIFPCCEQYSHWVEYHLENDPDYKIDRDIVYTEIRKKRRIIQIAKIGSANDDN